MPHRPSTSGARRRLLITTAAAVAVPTALGACASRGPAPPRQVPARVGLLPIEPYGEVGLYYSSSSKQVAQLLFGGVARVFMWGKEKEVSKEFTRQLSQHGLQAAERLHQGVSNVVLRDNPSNVAIGDRERARAALKAWKFAEFAGKVDALVQLQLEEVAYAAESNDRYLPRIKASMLMASTRDNEEIAWERYHVRTDADTSSPRDMTPMAASGFDDTNLLLNNLPRAVEVIYAELDRIIALVAKDVATLQRGGELTYEVV